MTLLGSYRIFMLERASSTSAESSTSISAVSQRTTALPTLGRLSLSNTEQIGLIVYCPVRM